MAKADRMFESKESHHDEQQVEDTGDLSTKSAMGNNKIKNSFMGFSTGGSNARIAISEESMAKADRMFESKDGHHDLPTVENARDPKMKHHDIREPQIDTLEISQKVRFNCAQSKTSNAVVERPCHDSNHSTLEEAGISYRPSSAGYTLAGSSRGIHVSADCLATTNKLYEVDQESQRDDSDDNPSDVPELGGQNAEIYLCPGVAQQTNDARIETFVTPNNRRCLKNDSVGATFCSSSRNMEVERACTSSKSNACLSVFENVEDANFVTDEKCTPLAQNDHMDRRGKTVNVSSSPYERKMYHPLHEMTNVAHDSVQSVMKSKRLFENTPKERAVSAKEIKPATNDSLVSPHYSKVTLSQFATNHYAARVGSWNECIALGVNDVTMRVNSTNAVKLRFSKDDETTLFFLGQRDAPKCIHVGKTTDINEWLSGQGCDSTLFTTKWIQNHYRWIVWKLAAMERRFPERLGGRYLKYRHILSQLKGRYEKELRSAKRPAVRKVLNRDVSAGMPMILCVSQILRFKSKLPKDGDQSVGKKSVEEIRLELTDGWYALSSLLDDDLTNLVEQGKIQAGSKLMICNAQLVGTDDGVDPLDDDYYTDRRTCPVFLKISANNSRLATWDAKLGFVHPKYTAPQGGSLLVKSLCDIFPNGGTVPVMDLVVCKKYPQMFLEKITDNGNQSIVANHLTEAEDAARQSEHDTNHQRASEKFAESALKECSEEVDEDAPTDWKDMVASNSPEEHYEKLGVAEKKIVDDWTKKRLMLLQSMVSKSIEESLKDHSSSERTSEPYIKVLVKAFCHSRQIARNLDHHAKTQKMSAELTIWRVSEEQLQLMKEGTIVRMKNLGVKSNRGGLQLSANSDTPMEPFPSDVSQYQLIQSGYEERCPRSLIRINLMSKKCEPSHLAREIDLVACIVKIQKLGDNTSAAYLTDESGLLMILERNHTSQNSDPFHLGNVEASLPSVVAFCNIQVTSFDTVEQCARGAWSTSSCKAPRHLMQLRCEGLQAWCNSYSGVGHCRNVLDRINAGVPMCAGPSIRHKVCIGYILGFDACDANCDPITSTTNVAIDYGDEFPLTVRFPLHLLPEALHLSQNVSTAHHNGDGSSFAQENILDHANLFCHLPSLGEYFQNNQTLFHFSLETASCYYGDELPVPEVTKISLATTDALSRLHLTGD